MARRIFYEDAPDRFLLLSSIAFDSSVAGVFWTLLEGGTLVLPPENAQRDPIQIAQILGRDRISHTLAVPTLYQHILETAIPEQISSLRVAIVAGEACPSNLPRLHMSKVSGADLFNEYGPTEGAVWSTGFRYAVDSSETKMPIGKPIANTKAYVVDTSSELAAMGVAGELFVGGGGIARGYLNQAGMTAERFVPNPFSHRAGERLYRTGDLVRWGEDSNLEFLGRIDHQVKIRGYRIELEDIEAALNSHHQVKQSVVITGENGGGGKRLLGYVVGEEGVTSVELKRHVRERLPEYMVPEVIMALKEMPLTANGKVDRKKLRLMEGAGSHLEQKDVVPRTPVEEILLGIFKEVLKLDRVGRGDSFFDIGGHSLLATQVASRVRSAFGVEIRVGTIFEAPTVGGLARRTEEMIGAGEKDGAPPLVRVSREGRLPLSFAQQRLWFLDQLVPNNPFYNCPSAMRLGGRVDLESLERVINEIIRRHEVLRTRFEVIDGSPVQVVDAWKHWRLELEDLTSVPRDEREEETRRRAIEEARKCFDLSKGPLLRVKALKLEEEDHVLLYTMHHIVSDGWSMGVLRKEVDALYQAYSAGEPSPLEELEIQYADYAAWQREWLKGEALEAELEYWRKQLDGMENLELPTDYPRPAVQSYRGSAKSFVIERKLSEALRELSAREGVTLFMTMLGGLDVLLSRYSGQEDVALGTDIANRNREEIEGLIGFFVNQLVLRVEVKTGESFRELLKRVREVCLGAYAHQDAPFDRLVEELRPERDLSRAPIFQSKLIWQDAAREELGLGGTTIEGVRGAGVETTTLDLTASIIDAGSDLVGVVEYSRDLFEEETIERMISHYLNVLRGVVEDSKGTVCSLNLLSDREREQIVMEWNETIRSYPNDQYVHKLFQEKAQETPERIAVICEGQQVSYGELNRRANRLGRYLQALGVGPEVVVAVCLERSVEMVVAILGALKAGGAYLPLDLDSPLERLALMLEDAGVVVALTRQGLEARLPSFFGQTVLIDAEWERISEQSEREPEGKVEAESLAYVIYTSGSTGRPKGVMINHGGLANYLKWATEAYRIEEGEGAPVHSSIGFDLTVTSLYGPLVNGKGVNLLSEHEGIYALATALSREGEYSLVKITPAHLEVLAQQLVNSEVEGRTKALVIGGEQLKAGGLKYWQERARGTRLINEYGPTETVVGCCVYEVNGGKSRREAAPIGKPIANTQIYLLDRRLEPVPIGVRGEIYISGAGLARGYVRSPELTGEKFIPNRFSRKGAERLYKTGDLGRYLNDGNIEFIGRADDQVKVRGYRIELGEIEAALLQHQAIKEGVVVARGDKEKRLIAYLVSRHSERVALSELREYLKQRLPEYMVPSAYLWLEKMPVTSNGKLDRKALPDADESAIARRREYVAPSGALEETLAGIWSEILGIEKVGIHDNFFELGGHSLLMISLIERMRQQGLYTDVRTFYATPTLAALASTVTNASDVVQVPSTKIPSLEKKVRI
jgi:amino acid adenylation domain-containing protein